MTSQQPITASRGTRQDFAWKAAVRAEEWAGEMRVNLIRLVAITVFYGNHLFNFYLRDLDLTPRFHLIVSSIAVSWATAAFVTHLILAKQGNRPFLKYASLGWDVFMTTSLIAFSGGPKSQFLILLLLILFTVPLRLNLRLVWVASLAAALSYGTICGHSKWVNVETQVPIVHHVIFFLGLATAGLLAGQCVRQARRFAENYSERLLALNDDVQVTGDSTKISCDTGEDMAHQQGENS